MLPDNNISPIKLWITLVWGTWYLFIIAVQLLGLIQLYRHYSVCPKEAASITLEIDNVPHVTILRPIKGLEPYLYECLAATFRQTYPRERLTVYLCIATAKDPAFPLLRQLLVDFSNFDAKIYIEDEDEDGNEALNAYGPKKLTLGPNPKIRNLRRGYRDAKGDIIWILDCNVWVGPGVAGRMVDKLCGLKPYGARTVPYKLVHQLPIVIDSVEYKTSDTSSPLSGPAYIKPERISSPLFKTKRRLIALLDGLKSIDIQKFGGRLEEMFMSSSHAKFYAAINTVSVAPCVVGKSNMFRKSQLDYVTRDRSYNHGLDYFSENICEDQLIGDSLWNNKVKEEEYGQKFHRHGLLFGDLAIQPMTNMSIPEYIGRRVRWLRVRKWIVPLATLLEPGVEPFLCSAYGAFAFISLSFFKDFNASSTWLLFALAWILSVSVWMFFDNLTFEMLHSGISIEFGSYTPSFILQLVGHKRRPVVHWVVAWLGRELLALPIWIWACLCGTTVVWRGKRFRVKFDSTVCEVSQKNNIVAAAAPSKAHFRSKARKD